MRLKEHSASKFEPIENERMISRIRTETRLASIGTLPLLETVSAGTGFDWIQSYRTRALEEAATRAVAINDNGQRDELETVRNLLATGRLAEADDLLLHLEYASVQSDTYTFFRTECQLERARFLFYSGRWEACSNLVARCLNQDEEIPLVTRLTLMQVQAAAAAEVSDWDFASRILDRIGLLSETFPFGNVPFYSKNLRAKVMHATQHKAEARSLLDSLWNEKTKTASADRVLTLARTEMLFERNNPQYILNWWKLANAAAARLADPLYRGVVACEAYSRLLAFRCQIPFELVMLVRESRRTFEWCAQIGPTFEAQTTVSESVNLTGLWFADHKLFIDSASFELHDLSNSERLPDAMSLICNGVHRVSDLFQQLYGRSYVPHLHQSVIKTLISRLRRKIPVQIRIKRDNIEMPVPRPLFVGP